MFIHLAPVIHGQELPPIHNFSPATYLAGNQNWAITQNNKKLIYVANNDGLLEYSGANWKLYRSPNESIMRSVLAVEERIYSGCYMEFGYWVPNEFGMLCYTSISQQSNIQLLEDEEFWNIINIDEFLVFQSLSRIYIYNQETGEVRKVESGGSVNKMFKLNGTLIYHRLNDGLYKVENTVEKPFLQHPILAESEVIEVTVIEDKTILITSDQGIYEISNGSLQVFDPEINERISSFVIYDAALLTTGELALGTISGGLVKLDIQSKTLTPFNQNNGLINNTVLSILEDRAGNIWLGLDNGVSVINNKGPIQVFQDLEGVLGSVYAAATFNDNLYLGTNQGLFYKDIKMDNAFKLVPNTKGQVWDLSVVNGQLFCSHHKGTFLLDGSRAIHLSTVPGTWTIKQLDSNHLIQGNYDGLYILEQNGNGWKIRNKIEGFNNSSRSFEVKDNLVFVNHEYQGIFVLTLDESFRKVIEVKKDTLLRGANSSISKFNQKILYASKNGLFYYDPATNHFSLDSTLSAGLSDSEYSSGTMLPLNSNRQFWYFTKQYVIKVTETDLSENPSIEKIPLSLQYRGDVVEYESITPYLGPHQYLLGNSNGYMVIDTDEFEVEPFEVVIKTIHLLSTDADHDVNGSVNQSFNSSENDLAINFYAAEYYTYYQTFYQYKLIGADETWSEWTTNSDVTLNNLSPGTFTFQVRAKIGDTISQNIAEFNFEIAPPWYASNLMIVIYMLGIIVLAILLHHGYRRYYRSQQKKLIERNKKELELAQLQNEKEIMDLKNRQLEKDVISKRKELASSTMGIVRKNELLQEIKDKLSIIQDKSSIAPVIKIIDKNIDHDENWELFEEAINNVDSDFFKRILNIQPDLSHNDLKLCTYLRLNLTSKEIAPMFNISPRSVEVKRYRLRKKLNLDTDQNLADYIMNI